MDAITLQCFLAVAATGNFTLAAERVGRTQSAVSQQIAKLEHLLGKPLIIRGRKLTLTHDGDVFLGYAQRILTLYTEALDRFKKPELVGEVRFGLPEDFATVFLSDVLTDFSRIHPRILVNIECDLTLNLFDRFKKKEFDLVLVKMSRPEDFPNGLEVWSEKLEWVGKQSLLSSFTLDTSQALPLVLAPQPCVYRARAIKALEKGNIRWRLALSSPSYAGMIAAVKAGLGITVLPKTMITGTLQILKSAFLPKLRNTHVSLLKHNKDNPVIASFEEFVLNKIKH